MTQASTQPSKQGMKALLTRLDIQARSGTLWTNGGWHIFEQGLEEETQPKA
jgi:hypothetical protein